MCPARDEASRSGWMQAVTRRPQAMGGTETSQSGPTGGDDTTGRIALAIVAWLAEQVCERAQLDRGAPAVLATDGTAREERTPRW